MEGMNMKAKYIGEEMVTLEKGKTYDVISVERGLYRIVSELGEDYLFPPELFEVVEE